MVEGANLQALGPLLRREIPRIRPEFRVSGMRTQQQLIDSQTVRERLLGLLAASSPWSRYFLIAAALQPAAQAMRIDPAVLLRAE